MNKYTIKANNDAEFAILASFFRSQGHRTRHMESCRQEREDYLDFYWGNEDGEISGNKIGDYDSLENYFDDKKGFRPFKFDIEGVCVEVEKDNVYIDIVRLTYDSIRKIAAALPS